MAGSRGEPTGVLRANLALSGRVMTFSIDRRMITLT
jgi:hypothetical protein